MVLAMDNKHRLNLRKITMISVLGLLGLALVGSFVSPAAGAASSPLMIPHIDPHALSDMIPHIDPHSVDSNNGNGWAYGWGNGQGNGWGNVAKTLSDMIPHIDPH
jgi:hypothetical protein